MSVQEIDEERYATQRGRYLARTTDLRAPEAKAISYAELGYSTIGISKQIDVSQSTVQEYLEKAMALYGLDIAETLLPDEEPPDYERVEPGYHDTLSDEEGSVWVKYVDRHRDKLPREWVHDVTSSAREDGLKP
jgi:hypothetical protein